jgi:hypothetical protein
MVSKARTVKRQKRKRPVLPFAPWEVPELATAANVTDSHLYHRIAEREVEGVKLGRSIRVPYAVGKKILGNPSDEQILQIRHAIAAARYSLVEK